MENQMRPKDSAFIDFADQLTCLLTGEGYDNYQRNYFPIPDLKAIKANYKEVSILWYEHSNDFNVAKTGSTIKITDKDFTKAYNLINWLNDFFAANNITINLKSKEVEKRQIKTFKVLYIYVPDRPVVWQLINPADRTRAINDVDEAISNCIWSHNWSEVIKNNLDIKEEITNLVKQEFPKAKKADLAKAVAQSDELLNDMQEYYYVSEEDLWDAVYDIDWAKVEDTSVENIQKLIKDELPNISDELLAKGVKEAQDLIDDQFNENLNFKGENKMSNITLEEAFKELNKTSKSKKLKESVTERESVTEDLNITSEEIKDFIAKVGLEAIEGALNDFRQNEQPAVEEPVDEAEEVEEPEQLEDEVIEEPVEENKEEENDVEESEEEEAEESEEKVEESLNEEINLDEKEELVESEGLYGIFYNNPENDQQYAEGFEGTYEECEKRIADLEAEEEAEYGKDTEMDRYVYFIKEIVKESCEGKDCAVDECAITEAYQEYTGPLPVQVLSEEEIMNFVESMPKATATQPPVRFKVGYIKDATDRLIAANYKNAKINKETGEAYPKVVVLKATEFYDAYLENYFDSKVVKAARKDEEPDTEHHRKGFSREDRCIFRNTKGELALCILTNKNPKTRVQYYMSVDGGEFVPVDKEEIRPYATGSAFNPSNYQSPDRPTFNLMFKGIYKLSR